MLVQPGARPYNPDGLKTAQLMRSDLAKIGVSLKIVQQAWPVIETRLAGQYDNLLSGWIADNADPDSFFRQLLSCAAVERGNNYSRWCSLAFDQLLDDAGDHPAARLPPAQLLLCPVPAQRAVAAHSAGPCPAHAGESQRHPGAEAHALRGTTFNQAYRGDDD